MDAQTSLLYGDARPDVIHKLLLWDDFAGALRQIYKNVERPAAEGKLQAIASKHPFSARKLERAKPQASINAIARHGCQRLQSTFPRAVERLQAFRWLHVTAAPRISRTIQAQSTTPGASRPYTSSIRESRTLLDAAGFRWMPAAARSTQVTYFSKPLRGFCTQF
jgi:hypothetical protein